MTSDAPEATAPQSQKRPGLIATIILCVVLLAYTALLSVDGLFIGFVSDSCSPGTCNTTLLGVAVILGAFGPAVVSVLAIVISIVRLVRRRRFTWLIPIGAGIVGTIVLFAAAAIGYASAGQNFFTQL